MQILMKKHDRKQYTIFEYIHTFIDQPNITKANVANERFLLVVSE